MSLYCLDVCPCKKWSSWVYTCSPIYIYMFACISICVFVYFWYMYVCLCQGMENDIFDSLRNDIKIFNLCMMRLSKTSHTLKEHHFYTWLNKLNKISAATNKWCECWFKSRKFSFSFFFIFWTGSVCTKKNNKKYQTKMKERNRKAQEMILKQVQRAAFVSKYLRSRGVWGGLFRDYFDRNSERVPDNRARRLRAKMTQNTQTDIAVVREGSRQIIKGV